MLLRYALLAGCCALANLYAGEADVLERVVSGAYSQIQKGATPREQAAWAFAQFHLKPGRDVAEAAQAAHAAGEPLGTYVLLLCHRQGVGLRQDEATLHKLNFDLRTALEKKIPAGGKSDALTPLEEYMLSRLMESNAEGVVTTDKPDESLKNKFSHQDLRWQRLVSAAERGVAQAQDDVGRAYQNDGSDTKAYEYYARAAKSGLASGLRNQGFFLMSGRGCAKNEEQAFAVTQQAAERCDVGSPGTELEFAL